MAETVCRDCRSKPKRLKVPQKQRKEAKKDGAALAERPNNVWSYDFVEDRTADGRAYRTLNIIDDYTREALMIRVDRKLNSTDLLDALTDFFILRGPLECIRSDYALTFKPDHIMGARHKYHFKDWTARIGQHNHISMEQDGTTEKA